MARGATNSATIPIEDPYQPSLSKNGLHLVTKDGSLVTICSRKPSRHPRGAVTRTPRARIAAIQAKNPRDNHAARSRSGVSSGTFWPRVALLIGIPQGRRSYLKA